MVALVIEFLFAVVFARALVSYLRRRDAVQRDVMLVFSGLAALVAIDAYRRVVGQPPDVLRDVAAVLIFGQPYLTLRLISRLRPVPRWLLWAVAVGAVGTAVPLLVLPRPIPPVWTLSAISVFLASGLVAAAFLGAEARRRTGSPRVRLWLASAATAMIDLALLVVAVGVTAPAVAQAAVVTSRGLALLSGLAYLTAFIPPASLRRLWSASAAYTVARRLLYAGDEPPQATWRRYADAVREVAGADGAAVVAVSGDGALLELGAAGLAPAASTGLPAEELEKLLAAVQPVDLTARRRRSGVPALAAAYGRRGTIRYVRAVPLPLRSGGRAALLLLNRYRSLFVEDDARVLADIGGQAAILAERSADKAAAQRLATELAGTVSALQTTSQAKTDFLSNMSHELRTPLNAIIGFSDLMRAETLTDEQRTVPAAWIDNVLSSGQHLLRLINDLLDLAKVEAGRMELDRRQLPLPTAVAEVTAAQQPLMDRKRLRLDVAVPDLTVFADPIRFRQILDNLLSNAIKFTPEGGHISIRAARADDDVQLSVADTGVGIALADQQRVFEEFQQAGDASARREGTGLGLALTRRLVEAHGGRIDLDSAPGRGTCFTVHLPVGSRHLDQTGAAPVPPHEAQGGILVIDGDPIAADLLRTVLQSARCRVTVAATGEAGLAAAEAHRPDAILLEVVLPDMAGWDVVRHVKRDPRLRDIPVFVVTTVDEYATGRALGVTDYFVKPVDRHRLLARLAEHVLTVTPPLERLSVLLIDNDPAALQLMQTTLRQADATITTTANPAEGLRLAHTGRYDLVVTDLAMPDIDGYTLITSLRSDPTTRHIPILAVTGQDLDQIDRARLDGKVIGVVTKAGDLAAELRYHVAARAAAPLAPPAGSDAGSDLGVGVTGSDLGVGVTGGDEPRGAGRVGA